MAKYKGFNCDSCGKVVSEEARTKKTTRFEGPTINGAYNEDLCPDCAQIPEGVNFNPFKPRKKADDAAATNGDGTVEVPDAPAPAAAAAATA